MESLVLRTAEEGLRYWLQGVGTHNWAPYRQKLTADYPDIVLSAGEADILGSAYDLTERLGQLTIQHVVRVTTNQQTVVFELESFQKEICLALSFDVRDEKIAACRAYYSG